MAITVRRFLSGDEECFRTLNEAWIEQFFGIEEADRLILGEPLKHILAPGGQIYMALEGEHRVGTCALIKMSEGEFELAKMAVANDLRGKGIGRQLLAFALSDASRIGATRLYIESNSSLKNAIHLYESFGFRHLPPGEVQPHFARGDVFMELLLGTSSGQAAEQYSHPKTA